MNRISRMAGYLALVAMFGGWPGGETTQADQVKQSDLTRDPKQLEVFLNHGQPFSGVADSYLGEVRIEYHYDQGRQDLIKRFDPQGRLLSEHRFDQSRNTQTSISYHPNGQKKSEEICDIEPPFLSISRTVWDGEGHPISQPPVASPAPLRDLGFFWKQNPTQLIVAAVRPSSAAAEGKFQIGDVILKVEGKEVNTPQLFGAHVGSFMGGARLKIMIRRKTQTLTLLLTVPTDFSPVQHAQRGTGNVIERIRDANGTVIGGVIRGSLRADVLFLPEKGP